MFDVLDNEYITQEENYIEYVPNQIEEEVVEEEIVEDVIDVVSSNEIQNGEILEVLKRMEEDLNDIKGSNERLLQESSRTIILSSVSDNTVSNNNNESIVSDNIINKPINEYSVGQSLGFIGILMALIVGFVIIINKGVFRWN